MMYSKYIAFAWLLLLLLAHRTSAQVTNSQLASARQKAHTYATNLSVWAKEPNNGAARVRMLDLFEGQTQVYDDLLPGNNKADFAVYFAKIKNFGGYISMDFLNTAANAEAWYVNDQGHLFIVLKMEKKISGGRITTVTINNYLIINTISGKIAGITSALPGDAKPMNGGGGNTPSDRDGDGIPDEYDSCPDKKGVKAFGGCPDSDNDGLPDHLDNCPSQYGPRSNGGCPENKPLPPSDRDGDGVPDSRDDCPDTYARTSNGCPTPPPPPPSDMVLVQGGSFTRDNGSSVTLSSYYIGKHEVSLAAFKAFVDDTNYRTDAEKGDGSYVYVGGNWSKKAGVSWRDDIASQRQTDARHPVIHVSWNDAVAYCQWKSRKTGETYRLPTEAEWEFAARGGKQSRGYEYAGSNSIDEVAWYSSNAGNKTHPVGGKKANELGIYDMSGNVLEWCQDWYGNYPSGSVTNPTGPSSGSGRVLRGGSWISLAEYCRVASRLSNSPDFRSFDLGFRLAKTVSL